MHITQEKLAELADVSVQMVKQIEGRQTWVSDVMLAKLAHALKVRSFQLLVPVGGSEISEDTTLISGMLTNLHRNIQDDISSRFDRFLTKV